MVTDVRMIQLLMELRRGGISDSDVLSAIEMTPRDAFVPEVFRDRAFDNVSLPIEEGQSIGQPFLIAFMIQALELKPGLRVLEVGTGSGYAAAILSKLCKRVYTIERLEALARRAQERLRKLLLFNVDYRIGDGTRGWPGQAPFDRIVVWGAVSDVLPADLLAQLHVKGQMIIPVDRSGHGQVLVRTRRSAQGFQSTDLLPVKFVPMLEGVAKRDGAPG
ncbi:MAG: protein-L-isoaspartate(D-aspartate) O-methyltransferase [Alphaproteobacteria bacterium]|jgi:protein-L-isoaspartate(D-aspartate) O-methyltransferase